MTSKLWGSSIPNLVLEALTQAKQDLEKVNAELDYIKEEVEKSNALYNARNALEQITHDNSEKANSVEHKE